MRRIVRYQVDAQEFTLSAGDLKSGQEIRGEDIVCGAGGEADARIGQPGDVAGARGAESEGQAVSAGGECEGGGSCAGEEVRHRVRGHHSQRAHEARPIGDRFHFHRGGNADIDEVADAGARGQDLNCEGQERVFMLNAQPGAAQERSGEQRLQARGVQAPANDDRSAGEVNRVLMDVGFGQCAE